MSPVFIIWETPLQNEAPKKTCVFRAFPRHGIGSDLSQHDLTSAQLNLDHQEAVGCECLTNHLTNKITVFIHYKRLIKDHFFCSQLRILTVGAARWTSSLS